MRYLQILVLISHEKHYSPYHTNRKTEITSLD